MSATTQRDDRIDGDVTAISACQLCGGRDLQSVVFLGNLPGVNALTPIGQASDHRAWPLELLRCPDCELAQLGHIVAPSRLFPPEYPYRSRTTAILRNNFADLYQKSLARLALQKDDLIIDIGSNDGTLLENFRAGGHRVLGIEPSHAARDAIARGIPTIEDFFTPELAERIRSEHGPARLVTAANVFAHIPQPQQITQAITTLLGEGGVFVNESHYLGDLIKTVQYDTIYHEHLRYYSFASMQALLSTVEHAPFDVERIPTHGGSIRVWAIGGTNFIPEPSVPDLIEEEQQVGLGDGLALRQFAERMVEARDQLWCMMGELRRAKQVIAGVGAPSRASTLLLFSGIDHLNLRCIYEIKGSPKIGHWMPGTRIPVRDETELYRDPPDILLLLSWHIADELIANIRKRGYRGKFLIPLPEPRLIEPD